jgi:hypothetical protein
MPPFFFLPSSAASSFAAALRYAKFNSYLAGLSAEDVPFPKMLQNLAKSAVFANKLQSRFWAHTLDWFEVVTSKKDT